MKERTKTILRRVRLVIGIAIVSISAVHAFNEFQSTWPDHPGDCGSQRGEVSRLEAYISELENYAPTPLDYDQLDSETAAKQKAEDRRERVELRRDRKLVLTPEEIVEIEKRRQILGMRDSSYRTSEKMRAGWDLASAQRKARLCVLRLKDLDKNRIDAVSRSSAILVGPLLLFLILVPLLVRFGRWILAVDTNA